MDSIQIEGGIPLQGQIKIQGSKNATLPILAATVLIPGVSRIDGCPNIADVDTMVKLLRNIGCVVTKENHTIIVDATKVRESRLPKEDVVKMRSSIMLMGALIGRMGQVCLDYPGGCVIGKRPVDIHLMALKKLGVMIEEEADTITAVTDSLKGSSVVLPFSSVGATENSILAAVCAEGITQIYNAAQEPEIISLCEFLCKAGATITGQGTGTITILGTRELQGVAYQVPSDRIVAGSYVFAGIACGGEICLLQPPTEHMDSILLCAGKLGARIIIEKDSMVIQRKDRIRAVPYLRTEVYPGFPTDLQSFLIAACTLAEGKSKVEETIFENRYKVVKELQAMGADIAIHNREAVICGVKHLNGKNVLAEELRGGAALVVAGMAANGITVVGNKHFIDRGYEDICGDLSGLGAKINAG